MLKKITNLYKSIRSDYLNRSPRGKWLFVRNVGIFVLTLTGVPFLSPNFKVWWYSYAAGIVSIDTLLSFCYTLWYYADTPVKALLFTPLLGILIPSILIYVLIMIPSKLKQFQSISFFAGEKIYTDFTEECDPSYIHVCDQSAIKLLKSTTITIGMVVVSAIFYLTFPILAFILYNDIQLPIPVLLPFTDMESGTGITLNLLNQLFIAVIGITGNIGIEIATCMFKNSVWASTVVIRHSINEFSTIIVTNAKTSTKILDYRFRNILMQVQDYDRFILDLTDLYYWTFFLQPFMLTASVSLAAFFYLYGVWMSGVAIVVLSYSQLFILCDIGNEVDSANEMLLLGFHEIPWYLMSQENQLAYAHLLNRLQNGAIIQMGPFDVLNFETFSNMTKRIYSFLMMLLSFLE